jgi:hypothetical protein
VELHRVKLPRKRTGGTLQRNAMSSYGSQRAWLRIEKGVTICGSRMRQTHLPHVYVEWTQPGWVGESIKQYTVPVEERELESMRLDWSYLEGRDSYRLRRDIQEAVTAGCWIEGTLAELRQLQMAGKEGTGSLVKATWC